MLIGRKSGTLTTEEAFRLLMMIERNGLWTHNLNPVGAAKLFPRLESSGLPRAVTVLDEDGGLLAHTVAVNRGTDQGSG